MSNTKISIILPCYNVERYIAECLDSLYAQDIPETEYEVICVNDCSPDGTRDIIVNYQQKHTNLILIDHEVNKRQGGARNTGLKAAKGEYIWFVDPDDFVKENIFKYIKKLLRVNDIEILQFNIEINDVTKLKDFESSNLKYETTVQTGVEYLKMIMNIHWGRTVEVCRRIYCRKFLIENNLVFPVTFSIGEDAVFFYKCILKCKRHKQVADYFYTYRVDNMSSAMNTAALNGTKLAERLMSSIEIIKLFHYSEIQPIDFRKKCINTYVWSIKKLIKKLFKLPISEQNNFYEKLKKYDLSILKQHIPLVISMLLSYPALSKTFLLFSSPFLRFIYSLKKHFK